MSWSHGSPLVAAIICTAPDLSERSVTIVQKGLLRWVRVFNTRSDSSGPRLAKIVG